MPDKLVTNAGSPDLGGTYVQQDGTINGYNWWKLGDYYILYDISYGWTIAYCPGWPPSDGTGVCGDAADWVFADSGGPNARYSTNQSWGLADATVGDPAVDPTVNISATSVTASESGSVAGVFRIDRGVETSGALTVTYAVDEGSTAAQADYSQTLSGVATITAGATSVSLTITPVDDLDVEEAETLILTLSAGTGYSLGGNTSATVTITSNDVPPATPSANQHPAFTFAFSPLRRL